MKRLDPETTKIAFNQLMRTDLGSFVHRCFLELNPSTQMSSAPHLKVLAAKLEDCLSGNGPKRLIVNLPPRSLKSMTISVAATAWLLGREPTKHIICASYGQVLADKLALDTRAIMTSSFFQEVFPQARLSKAKHAVSDFMTTKQGSRMATSVTGVLTGRGADVIIIDDPLKPEDALSDTFRDAVNSWYDSTLLSRLNNKVEGIIIIVMQRLHQDDLVGHVLERGEEWEVLSFPAIAEVAESHVYKNASGEHVFKRAIGDVLDPIREPLKKLLETKALIGSYNFASQFQQSPAPVGGAMVLLDWLQYYDATAPLPRFTTVLQSWDTANKSGQLNDYSVCTTWGRFDSKFYLLDVYRQRLDYPSLKRQVLVQSQKHSPKTILIEDRGSGTQLIQDLKSEGQWKVKGYDPPPQTDKIMRLHAQTAKFEGGKVLLPSTAPWLAEYIRELTTFPGTKFDDQVDSTTQALDELKGMSPGEIWAILGRQ